MQWRASISGHVGFGSGRPAPSPPVARQLGGRSARLAACGASFLLGGCGDGVRLGDVTGTILLDGRPLPGALVTFEPERGRLSAGQTDESGRYLLRYDSGRQGAVVGGHTARITAQTTDDGSSAAVPIPSRYNARSPYKVEVQEGDNVFDFALVSGGEVPKAKTVPGRPAGSGE